MTRSTMIILAPWILFSVALAAMAVRLLRSCGGLGRRTSAPGDPKAPARKTPRREEPGD